MGKIRARQLSSGTGLTLSTIKRMYSYLSRAEEYYDESDTKACGTLAITLGRSSQEKDGQNPN